MVTRPPRGPVTTTRIGDGEIVRFVEVLTADSIINEVYHGELRALLDGVFKEIGFTLEADVIAHFIPAAFEWPGIVGKEKGKFINLDVCAICVFLLHGGGI